MRLIAFMLIQGVHPPARVSALPPTAWIDELRLNLTMPGQLLSLSMLILAACPFAALKVQFETNIKTDIPEC